MQWILLGMLLILTYGIYYFEGKDVASPTFITAVVFSVSSFFFAINANRWNRELEFQTILIIIGAVLVFFVGGRIRVIWSTNREIEYSGNVYYNLPKWVLLTFFGFNLGVSLLIYIRMSQILANVGTSQYALMALRTALNSGGYSWGMGISVLRESSYA
ncbi:MAG: hypothetical protein IJ324_09995, partial [Lachnospiraceae bacterium]|nr:hypothetical protein [Lachnospiraceae bacterium]